MKSFLIGVLFSTSVFAGIYDVKETSIEGKEFPMDQLKGKTVLVVNIASQCGYTPQMTDLENLYEKYKAKGFVLVGVPTNDFGGQTPEDDQAMKEFCTKKYNATYPIMKKGTILGKDKRELYKVLTEQSAKKYQGDVDWNFQKFLVNKKGEVVGRYSSSTKPMDERLLKDIEKNL
jgi:glutathione peroxidase